MSLSSLIRTRKFLTFAYYGSRILTILFGFAMIGSFIYAVAEESLEFAILGIMLAIVPVLLLTLTNEIDELHRIVGNKITQNTK